MITLTELPRPAILILASPFRPRGETMSHQQAAGIQTDGVPPLGYVFISYVREDSGRVDELQQALETAGIRVWRDTAALWPGEDWRAKIRQAIAGDALVFIACFSRIGLDRQTSYQNEELVLAVEQLRLRRPDEPWLIPVRFDNCEIPDLDIGGGRSLASFQWVDLFGDRPGPEVARLIAAVMRILARGSAASPAPAQLADRRQQYRLLRRLRRAGPRSAAAIVSLITVVLLATGAYLVSQVAGGQSSALVTGSVVCESGRPVIGVWIAASAGQDDSGFAHLGPPNPSGVSYPAGSEGTYSFRLAHGGSYSVHVGCGGSAHRWASKNYSPLLSSLAVRLRCDDPISSASKPGRRGKCAVVSRS